MPLRPLLLAVAALAAGPAFAAECVDSPGRVLRLCIEVGDGRATYTVARGGRPVLAPSTLGLVFAGEADPRYTGLDEVARDAVDTSWEQPWGEERVVRDRHAELAVTLRGDTALTRRVRVVFRLFDDGIGFRYAYPAIPAGRAVAVTADRTQFRTVGSYRAWWYEGWGQERDEYLYTETDARRVTLAETPLTMRRDDGLHLSFHEAALVDFPSMLLAGDGAGTLSARLMPWPDGTLAHRTGPFATPWRTVLMTDGAPALADSRIELNLNEPNRLGDVSWFKPGKYVGVWWEMHLKRTSWEPGPRHGATTANVERYMDFAARNGFDGVLVEGWNLGWDGDWAADGSRFRFDRPTPDFDVAAIAAYGRRLGVRLIGHNETGGAVENYQRQLDASFRFDRAYDIGVVKTGYVHHSGDIVDADGGRQWFAGQYMTRHNLLVATTAARYHVAIDAHEPVKDTGLRRTWPNMVSREGARGQEFNAWGDPTNPPEHLTILPFTRLLAGPMDFTPGIFDIARGGVPVTRRVQSTLATQLAEYVVIYSPIQMAADLPENYERNPAAFRFIRDVPTDWEHSRTLAGEVGRYVVVARQQRGGRDWYLGAITNADARTLDQSLDFLDPGRLYDAQIYADGPGADFRTDPASLAIVHRRVRRGDHLTLALAPGGGAAVRFKAVDQ